MAKTSHFGRYATHFKNQTLFSLFFVFSLFAPPHLLCDIQEVKIHRLKVEDCLLPEDHPLHDRLANLFKNPQIFKSNEHLRRAGFQPLNRESRPIMVARHAVIENYLIKKFKTGQTLRYKEINNYLDRISAARALHHFIKLNHLEHIVVPQKWLYPLPKRFSDSKSGKRMYVLIVEDMDICSGGDDPNGEIGRRYSNMSFEILRELCIVLYYFRGLDSNVFNIPFTHQNKIAFVDTEKWKDVDREFLSRVKHYLNQDQLEYAARIFEELREQDKR